MCYALHSLLSYSTIGVQQSIQFPISTAISMNTQSILSAEYDRLLLAGKEITQQLLKLVYMFVSSPEHLSLKRSVAVPSGEKPFPLMAF